MDKLYYQPNHLWKGQKAIKKLSSSPMECTLLLEPTIAYPEPLQIEPQNIVQPVVDVLDPTGVDPDLEPLQIKPQNIVQQIVDVLEPVEEPLLPVSTVAYGLDSDPEELTLNKLSRMDNLRCLHRVRDRNKQ